MTDRKILVPIDFSGQSKAALEYAAAFASDSDAELLIIYVMNPKVDLIEGGGPSRSLRWIAQGTS